MVKGCSGLCGPWVPYPVCFLDQFLPGFALACGVNFSLPPVDDRFSLWINLHEKCTLDFSGRLLHPCNPLGAWQRFFPLGASLTMGFLHSYHLDLFVVVFSLGSSPIPIHPFLVCKMAYVIASLWSMDIPGVSSLMGFPWLQARPGNIRSLIKVYLIVLFPYFGMCALGSPVVIPTLILFSALCTKIISTSHICTWVRCTHT